MFDDVIDRGETSLLLQDKSEGWAGEYVDLGEGDSIPNGAIIKAVVIERVKIYVFLSAFGEGSVVWSAIKGFTFFLQGKCLATTGATLSKKLTTPANAERLQLAKLFPSSRARSGSTFDPTADCVATPAHKKRRVVVFQDAQPIVMKVFRPFIPIKKYRCDLKQDQRIKTLQFLRGLSSAQVKNVIQRGFRQVGCSSFLFLETSSNSLRVSQNQQLDGTAVIGRRGALYLCEVIFFLACFDIFMLTRAYFTLSVFSLLGSLNVTFQGFFCIWPSLLNNCVYTV